MKKLFLAALLVVGITAFAQNKDEKAPRKERLTSEQKVDFQVKKMTKELSLTDKQAQDYRVLATAEVKKMEAKRAENKEKKREEMKAQMQTEQAAVSSEMKKILTPEQFAKWEKMREERKERMKEKFSEKRDSKELK